MSPCVSCGLPLDRLRGPSSDQSGESLYMCECCHRLGQCIDTHLSSALTSSCDVSCDRPRAIMDTRTDNRSAPSFSRSSSTPSKITSTSYLSVPPPSSTTKMITMTNSNRPRSAAPSRTTSCACQGECFLRDLPCFAVVF